MINASFEDWKMNPIATITTQIENPILEGIKFPSLTICEEEHQQDEWVIPEIILNFLKFTCGEETNCDELTRKDFEKLTILLHDKVSQWIKNPTMDMEKLDSTIDVKHFKDNFEKLLNELEENEVGVIKNYLLNNSSNIKYLEKLLINSIGISKATKVILKKIKVLNNSELPFENVDAKTVDLEARRFLLKMHILSFEELPLLGDIFRMVGPNSMYFIPSVSIWF